MKKSAIFFSTILAMTLTGCLDIKIRSEIPKKTYYDLDTNILQEHQCKTFDLIWFGGVTSTSYLDQTSILHKKSNGEVSTIANTLWMDNPKEMFKTILVKNGSQKCLSFENLSVEKPNQYLSIQLLFLGFVDEKSDIEFVYKIYDKNLQFKGMGTIHKEEPGTDIATLQKTAQSGINELLEILGGPKNEAK
ncbi:outer membrane protein [Helicobacter mustelae]|uniref:ABC-type transport auxiliary lipoprotein family protein n=1 Tax=Helicobacter mustelae TaxID=217 RepID=UPI000E05C960|nr:ABC-type transport auxiliary lipoprotein family protein [Helicobacter mustelae]STP13254.1 outer membrane protein [Helicobacter mustelae]